jgi:hypothetical protein
MTDPVGCEQCGKPVGASYFNTVLGYPFCTYNCFATYAMYPTRSDLAVLHIRLSYQEMRPHIKELLCVSDAARASQSIVMGLIRRKAYESDCVYPLCEAKCVFGLCFQHMKWTKSLLLTS